MVVPNVVQKLVVQIYSLSLYRLHSLTLLIWVCLQFEHMVYLLHPDIPITLSLVHHSTYPQDLLKQFGGHVLI